ncbi:MAG: peptidase S15, partial [Planctomycetales bacterium]|nr:peptidase S15 [Planctomycetales bacterium]
YTDYGVALQRRFFDHFLKGVDNGWDREPRVRLKVRHLDHFEERVEEDWPIPRTRWTRLNLHADADALRSEPVGAEAAVSFPAQGDGVTF